MASGWRQQAAPQTMGEIGLNGAVAATSVRRSAISGDQTACAEAAELFPGIATVKKAI
jgi:D-aminopeptidase